MSADKVESRGQQGRGADGEKGTGRVRVRKSEGTRRLGKGEGEKERARQRHGGGERAGGGEEGRGRGIEREGGSGASGFTHQSAARHGDASAPATARQECRQRAAHPPVLEVRRYLLHRPHSR
eukprot:scaffold159598_cov30-Tisochrysis_lutea.AAC.1